MLEWLWCCGKADMSLPPDSISEEAFTAAATLVGEYFMPMAERVFGDAGATDVERNAATLARWILKERPHDVHVRRVAARSPIAGVAIGRADQGRRQDTGRRGLAARAGHRVRRSSSKVVYAVNPRLWGR